MISILLFIVRKGVVKDYEILAATQLDVIIQILLIAVLMAE